MMHHKPLYDISNCSQGNNWKNSRYKNSDVLNHVGRENQPQYANKRQNDFYSGSVKSPGLYGNYEVLGTSSLLQPATTEAEKAQKLQRTAKLNRLLSGLHSDSSVKKGINSRRSLRLTPKSNRNLNTRTPNILPRTTALVKNSTDFICKENSKSQGFYNHEVPRTSSLLKPATTEEEKAQKLHRTKRLNKLLLGLHSASSSKKGANSRRSLRRNSGCNGNLNQRLTPLSAKKAKVPNLSGKKDVGKNWNDYNRRSVHLNPPCIEEEDSNLDDQSIIRTLDFVDVPVENDENTKPLPCLDLTNFETSGSMLNCQENEVNQCNEEKAIRSPNQFFKSKGYNSMIPKAVVPKHLSGIPTLSKYSPNISTNKNQYEFKQPVPVRVFRRSRSSAIGVNNKAMDIDRPSTNVPAVRVTKPSVSSPDDVLDNAISSSGLSQKSGSFKIPNINNRGYDLKRGISYSGKEPGKASNNSIFISKTTMKPIQSFGINSRNKSPVKIQNLGDLAIASNTRTYNDSINSTCSANSAYGVSRQVEMCDASTNTTSSMDEVFSNQESFLNMIDEHKQIVDEMVTFSKALKEEIYNKCQILLERYQTSINTSQQLSSKLGKLSFGSDIGECDCEKTSKNDCKKGLVHKGSLPEVSRMPNVSGSISVVTEDDRCIENSGCGATIKKAKSLDLGSEVSRQGWGCLGTPVCVRKRRILQRSKSQPASIVNSPHKPSPTHSNSFHSPSSVVSPFSNMVGDCERPSIVPMMTPGLRNQVTDMKSTLREQFSLLMN